jgi:hypothetical protein
MQKHRNLIKVLFLRYESRALCPTALLFLVFTAHVVSDVAFAFPILLRELVDVIRPL